MTYTQNASETTNDTTQHPHMKPPNFLYVVCCVIYVVVCVVISWVRCVIYVVMSFFRLLFCITCLFMQLCSFVLSLWRFCKHHHPHITLKKVLFFRYFSLVFVSFVSMCHLRHLLHLSLFVSFFVVLLYVLKPEPNEKKRTTYTST